MKDWKAIKGYVGKYIVSRQGLVKSLQKNIALTLRTELSLRGYRVVKIYGKTHLIHRLVAMAFIRNPSNKPCINHKNGIKTDNRVENLEWCTYSENLKHAYDNNIRLPNYGEKNGAAKLNRWQVQRIRLMAEIGNISQDKMAKIFKVARHTVSNVLERETWKHIN